MLGQRRVYFRIVSNLILLHRGNATKVWFQNMNSIKYGVQKMILDNYNTPTPPLQNNKENY